MYCTYCSSILAAQTACSPPKTISEIRKAPVTGSEPALFCGFLPVCRFGFADFFTSSKISPVMKKSMTYVQDELFSGLKLTNLCLRLRQLCSFCLNFQRILFFSVTIIFINIFLAFFPRLFTVVTVITWCIQFTLSTVIFCRPPVFN